MNTFRTFFVQHIRTFFFEQLSSPTCGSVHSLSTRPFEIIVNYWINLSSLLLLFCYNESLLIDFRSIHAALKMRVAILFFLVSFVASDNFSCYVRFHYAKVCHRFSFENDCQPYQLDKCTPTRVTHKDFHCPRYFCVSYCFFIFIFSLLVYVLF